MLPKQSTSPRSRIISYRRGTKPQQDLVLKRGGDNNNDFEVKMNFAVYLQVVPHVIHIAGIALIEVVTKVQSIY